MKIYFYKSILCPRCYMVQRHLQRLQQQEPDLEIEEIDITLSPRRMREDGIRMIPALKVGTAILCGIYLGRKQITAFLAKNHSGQDPTTS